MNTRFAWLAGTVGLAMMLPLRAAAESLPEQYLAVYLKINEAEQAERKQDLKGALDAFVVCYQQLLAIQKAEPDWQTALVLHRLSDCKAKIIELSAEMKPPTIPPVTFAPWPRSSHNIYPWKDNVAATEFWIGKDGVTASAWDVHWERNYGGTDAPDDRNGYAPGGHACGLNPFYVALPFNDLAHPDLAQKWLPKGWVRTAKDGKPVPACKDRWVELKNARGDVCYAQWEDAGPRGDDRADYIFGGAAHGKVEPGIGLSPAAYEYLGLSGDAQVVSWRFVDDADVRPGAWMKMDEQAVLYTAMHGSSVK